MPGIARLGDILGPGGVLGFPVSPNVLVNGRPVALDGARYSAHPCCGAKKCPPAHCGGPTSGLQAKAARVLVNGLPPILLGDPGACGHTVRTASENVFVGSVGR